MPSSHRDQETWTGGILARDLTIAPGIQVVCETIIAERHHPERGHDQRKGSSTLHLGSIALSVLSRHNPRSIAIHIPLYKNVVSILEKRNRYLSAGATGTATTDCAFKHLKNPALQRARRSSGGLGMLNRKTMSAHSKLRLNAPEAASHEQPQSVQCVGLSLEERFTMLVDREMMDRETRRLAIDLSAANLKHSDSIDELDLQTPTGLDHSAIMRSGSSQRVYAHQNILVTAPRTGVYSEPLAGGPTQTY